MSDSNEFMIDASGTLTKYTGAGGDVVIPDGVTSIGVGAFKDCTGLTSITIPNRVKSIGVDAFDGCSSLTSIIIPDSVTGIGNYAFYGCTSLTSIEIPGSVTSIGNYAFKGCTSLTNVKIPDSVTGIGSSAFWGCTSLTNVKIPDSVTGIGSNAFWGCTGLTDIEIPNSVTSIRSITFKGCTSLTNVKIPDSVTSIEERAFESCIGLTNIEIPNSVTSIGAHAFEGCKSLAIVYYGGNLRGWKGISIDTYNDPLTSATIHCAVLTDFGTCGDALSWAWDGNGTLTISGTGEMENYSPFYSVTTAPWKQYISQKTTVLIEEGVTGIGPGAFDGCTSLTSIEIPGSVTRIGEHAFSGCTGLTGIEIPNSVTSIEWSVFESCTGLTNIKIPNSVTSIGSKAFKDCTGLTGIEIPNSVTSIGWNVFKGCNSLTNVKIPDSVTSIGERAFEGCTGLTGIEIPNSVTSIGERAFSGCTGLTGIEVPNSVTSIEACAFLGCTGLTSVKIPDSVTDIGGWAFGDCNNLKELSIGNPKCKLVEDVFGETLPSGLINQLDMLATMMPASTLQKYILNTDVWCKLSVNRQAKFFLEQQGKDALAFYAENVTNVEELGKALLEELPQKPSVKACGAIALFMTRHSQQASSALLQQMHERLKPLKSAEKALKTIEANLELMTKLQPKTLSPLEQRMMGILQQQGLSGNGQDVKLKEYYGITLSKLPRVQCKDGSTAPASALGWLLTAHEKYYEPEEYKYTSKEGRKEVRVAYTKPGLCPEAEEILAELDSAGFQDFLHKLVDTLRGVERGKKLYLAYPIGRYADEERMAELVKIASSLRKRALVEIFERASLYNNTHAAMLYADKRGCLREYAKLRGTTEDDLRDTILSDVGLDENGGKTYDLGNQIVTARMQGDLSFLIELPDGKTAKSLPKKGADAEKYAAANTDFSNMKKNVKKIAKNRKDILFEEFLSRKSRSVQSWCDTYLSNPVLKSVASLLVWHQRKLTFTLKNGQPVDSTGQPYQIRPSTPIALAHPMEMMPAVVRAWQLYFVSKGIKQPFIQIWEPVIDPAAIRRERYKGIKIPGYRLMSWDKHGITVKYDWDNHEMFYYFCGCDVSCERLVEPPLNLTWNRFGDKVVDYSNQGIDPQEFFEISDFAFRKYTRQVNHIVGLLDKWTIYDFILKDDVTIVERLSSFTLAQIEEFLKAAMDNNCTNVTAALLEFKNDNFGDFDPMAEFTLDL